MYLYDYNMFLWLFIWLFLYIIITIVFIIIINPLFIRLKRHQMKKKIGLVLHFPFLWLSTLGFLILVIENAQIQTRCAVHDFFDNIARPVYSPFNEQEALGIHGLSWPGLWLENFNHQH